MSDDRTKRGPADRTRVNIHEPYEVEQWTQHFGCTESALRQAVNAVGPMVADVERYLRQHR